MALSPDAVVLVDSWCHWSLLSPTNSVARALLCRLSVLVASCCRCRCCQPLLLATCCYLLVFFSSLLWLISAFAEHCYQSLGRCCHKLFLCCRFWSPGAVASPCCWSLLVAVPNRCNRQVRFEVAVRCQPWPLSTVVCWSRSPVLSLVTVVQVFISLAFCNVVA